VVAQILNTKLYIPALRSNIVTRPRLLDQLDEGLSQDRKLSLISAPAGYGKTTLVIDWVHELQQRGTGVAWLTLDHMDNAPLRFWAYFLSSLRTIPQLEQVGLGESSLVILQSPQPPSVETLLSSLINDLILISGSVVLVLDDMHLVTDSLVHETLTDLMEHLPRGLGLHLVVAARSDPPWPIARIRSRGEMTEIRVHDLRFTTEEAALFFKQPFDLDLSPHDIDTLGERTEGWIAGLQMAALSMRGGDQDQDQQRPGEFIETFTGSHRYVLDYLIEEVFSQQPPEIQEFLLKTSILDRLSAPLCDAVCASGVEASGLSDDELDGTDSKRLLAHIDEANLFLMPLDDNRQWYRYHQLFADLLQARLRQDMPNQIPDLHQRSSVWYEEQGWVVESVRHALAADDIARAARLIEENVFTLLDQGDIITLPDWLDEIPGDLRQARPWLGIARAWMQVYAGRLDANAAGIKQVEQQLLAMEIDERNRASGHINAIRAYASWIRGDGESAITYARRALEQLPDDELAVRALVSTTLAHGLVQVDDLPGASRLRERAIAWSRASGNIHVYMLAASGFAFILLQQGRLHEAEALCRQALKAAGAIAGGAAEQSPAVAQVYAILSSVLLIRNEIKEAVTLAREGLRLGKRWAQADTLTVNYVYLTDALICAGDLEGAASAIDGAKRVGKHVSGWFDTIVGREEAEFFLARGNLRAAVHWAESRDMDYRDDVPQPSRSAYRTLVKVLIAQGRLGEASTLSDRLIDKAESTGASAVLVGLLSLKAVVLSKQGKHEDAIIVLGRALELAEPERIILPILRSGEPMVALLQKSFARGITPYFTRDLLALLESEPTPAGSYSGSLPNGWKTPAADNRRRLVEPLTARELDVIRLLNSGLSIPEIAREMYVAPSTIRTHVRNIYSKFDVHTRYEAVQRAKDLEII